MSKAIDVPWNDVIKDIVKKFASIVTDSPIATVSLVFSSFLGYGVSFTLFDYRRAESSKVPFVIHIVLGLGYASLVFALVNFDLLSRNLNSEQIISRIPITFLISFSVAFIIIVTVVLWRNR